MELHFEGFNVSATKDAIHRDAVEHQLLKELLATLRGGELDLVDQAENFRAREWKALTDPSFGAPALNQTKQKMEQAAATSDYLSEPFADGNEAEDKKPPPPLKYKDLINVSEQLQSKE